MEYRPVSPGILRIGDIVYEPVKFGQGQIKYREGKLLDVVGGNVAIVRFVGAHKSARIPFNNLVIGDGLFEARSNANSTRIARLEKFLANGLKAKLEPVPVPVTEPAQPSAPPRTPQDEFAAWLSMGVDFLPTLISRIKDKETELNNADATLAAVETAHNARLAAFAEELAAERDALRKSFEEQRRQVDSWKQIQALLNPLCGM
jgi:hypothetical protein